MQELYHSLLQDLKEIGLKEPFHLDLRPYSKVYYGFYLPQKDTIVIYIYKDAQCTEMYDYKSLLLTLVHEAVHCKQWKDPSFVRLKGVMHDPKWYALYDKYSRRATDLLDRRQEMNRREQTRVLPPKDCKKSPRCSLPRS